MQIKNCLEDFVCTQLEHVLTEYPDICQCNYCRQDIVALALNRLPPRYVVTDKGETFTKVQILEQQFKIDIITAITEAIKIVAANPRH